MRETTMLARLIVPSAIACVSGAAVATPMFYIFDQPDFALNAVVRTDTGGMARAQGNRGSILVYNDFATASASLSRTLVTVDVQGYDFHRAQASAIFDLIVYERTTIRAAWAVFDRGGSGLGELRVQDLVTLDYLLYVAEIDGGGTQDITLWPDVPYRLEMIATSDPWTDVGVHMSFEAIPAPGSAWLIAASALACRRRR